MNDATMTIPTFTDHAGTADLTELYLHPLNTRTEPPALDIAALADSIRSCGLLQNLLAYADPAEPGRLGIVAGGRRLRALELLAGTGDWPGRVPLRVTDDPLVAEVWANTENTARTALHPADEIRAYGRMAASGAPAATIARAFAVTEVHVKRRLRLAHLPDRALDGLKKNLLTLDQCAALTVSDDETRVAAVLDSALKNANMNAGWIRQQLVDAQISATDRRARFVTVPLYEAAGGATTRDLFTDGIWLHDEALLDQLFASELAARADEYRADGWGFVLTTAKSHPADDDRMSGKYEAIDPDPIDLPEADAEELEALSETPRWDLTDSESDRLEELEARTRGSFDDATRATLGCLLYVAYGGKLVAVEGLREKTRAPASDAGGDGDGDQPTMTGGGATPEPAISQVLREDFLTIRRAALQTAMLQKPDLMLDLLAFTLQWAEDGHSESGTLGVRLDRQRLQPNVPEGLALVPDLAADRAPHDFRNPTAADFTAFRSADGAKKARNATLTRNFARTIMALPGELTTELEALSGADIRAIWQPNVANCFGRMAAGALVEVYAECLQPEEGDPRFAAFQGMKKKDQARELDDLFHNLATREAYGLDRETGQRLDAWVPAGMKG